MLFNPYPFELLENLISSLSPKMDVVKLTIGEPQFDTPLVIQNALCENSNLLNKYPSSKGELFLKNSQINFVKNRFNVELNNDEILPTLGTREVLFNFPLFLFSSKDSKNMAFPNPFYKIYEGAAIASKANIIYMNLDSSNGFKPNLDRESLMKVDLVILNSPNNPTGTSLDLNELSTWAELAIEYNFVILSDECYSEIYEDKPPHSILEACINIGNDKFKNILAINSISKRSSAPGLRSGFIAGDSNILKDYMLYRTYLGCAIPLPLQKASSVAWNDNINSETFRKIYAKNLKLAREILDIYVPPYTFYVWIKVDNDLEFTKALYEDEGVLVLPGRFLGSNGKGYVRAALVYDNLETKQILERIKRWI